MEMKAGAGRILKIVLIVFLILVIVILVTSEIDRQRPRRVPCTPKMYYEGGNWITAPFNLFTTLSVRSQADLIPFPELKSNFPDHERLRSQWQRIRTEVLEVYARGEMTKIKGDLFFQRIADENWTRFYLKWYGPMLPDAREKLPFTTKLIDSFPEIKSAMISVLS